MAPSCVTAFATFRFRVLQAQKLMEVEKTVGQAKVEEELEGEVIIGPSGEVVKPSFYTPLFLSGIKLYFFLSHTVSLLYEFPFSFRSSSIRTNICLPDLPARSPLFIYGCFIWRCVIRRGRGQTDNERIWSRLGLFMGGSRGCQHWQRRRCRGCWVRYFSLLGIA